MTHAPHPSNIFHYRVYYEDTDAAGVVYYANYLKFAERARTEMLRAAHINQSELMRDHDVGFVVRRCTIDFLRPARLDDLLTIETRLHDIGRVSMDMQQTIRCGNEELATIIVRIASVGAEFKPVRIPAFVHDALLSAMHPHDNRQTKT